jgi:outer membrane protein assembly factor BamB
MSAVFLLSAMLTLSTPSDDHSHWPGFLGAGASPVPAESIPLEWSGQKNVAWQAKLPGDGQSSPVVWNGRVYITCVEGPMKDTIHLLAFNLQSGQQVWSHSQEAATKVKRTLYVSRAAPTPAIDADGVYAFFESGDLVATDHDGNVRWTRSLTKDFGPFQNRFCIGASLAQSRDAIYVLADHEGPSYILAIRKQDGSDIWKADRDSRVSWTSPSLIDVNGGTQLVVSSSGSVDGYDPETGKLLWSFTDVGGNTVTTPLGFGEGRFLVGASAGERGQYAQVAPKSNFAAQIVVKDGNPSLQKLWTAEKALASFASPVVYEGLAYWVNRVGVVFCFDAKTGVRKYEGRLEQSCWATPVGIGDRIYFFGKDGVTTVLATGPEFKKLAANQLWRPEDINVESDDRGAEMFGGRIQYGVAIANGNLLIRTGDVLYCVRQM